MSFPAVDLSVCPTTDVFAGGMASDGLAVGTASHLGLVTMTSRHCTPAVDTIQGGEGTFIAANGDEIYYTYEGSAPFPPGTTIIVATVDFVITGGTGRFADAHGGGEMIAYVTFEGFGAPAWAARWTWDGEIRY